MRQTKNNFTLLNRDYNTQRNNLSKIKLSFSFHSLLFLIVCLSQFFLTLSIFLFSFACSLTHTILQDCTQASSSLGLHFLLIGRIVSPLISSSFPSFLPFTLLTSNHNKCNSLALTLRQPLSFLLFLLSMSNIPKSLPKKKIG